MHNYDAIIEFFEQYINHYRELLAFENQKLQYIVSNNVTELSNSFGKEQALIMKSNNLEAKRVSLLKQEGFSEKKFSDMLENCPEEYLPKLSSIFSELSKYIFEVKRINDEAMNIVNAKLSHIEEKLQNNTGEIYDGKGDKKHTDVSSSLSKNI
jgi:hypothetical protein